MQVSAGPYTHEWELLWQGYIFSYSFKVWEIKVALIQSKTIYYNYVIFYVTGID